MAAGILALLWQGLLLLASALFPHRVVAGHGTLEIIRRTEAAIFRRETLLAAPCDGFFRRVHPAGERIARYGEIGSIRAKDGGTRHLRAPRAGLLAYTYDGRDPLPSTSALAGDPAAAYRMARELRVRRTGQGAVRRGEPLARLVDDEEQYLVAPLCGSVPPLPAGKKVWARLDGNLLPLAIVRTTGERGTTWVVLRTERFPRVWLDRRRVETCLVLERRTGVLVPADYLHRRGGSSWLRTMDRGRARYAPVRVLVRERGQAVVEGIPEGTVLLPR